MQSKFGLRSLSIGIVRVELGATSGQRLELHEQPTGAGTEARSAPTALAGKDEQKQRDQGGINAGRKHLS